MSLALALTATAATDLTAVYPSPLSVPPPPDRILRPPCGSLAGGSTRSVDREIDATGYVRSEMVERAID